MARCAALDRTAPPSLYSSQVSRLDYDVLNPHSIITLIPWHPGSSERDVRGTRAVGVVWQRGAAAGRGAPADSARHGQQGLQFR